MQKHPSCPVGTFAQLFPTRRSESGLFDGGRSSSITFASLSFFLFLCPASSFLYASGQLSTGEEIGKMSTITQPSPAVTRLDTTKSPSSPWPDAQEQSPTPAPMTLVNSPQDPEPVPYLKIASACFCFFIGGTNIGSVGALIPYIIRDYGVSTAIVSSVYVPLSDPPLLRLKVR